MDVESTYANVLTSATTYRVTDSRLELLADGKVLARFDH